MVGMFVLALTALQAHAHAQPGSTELAEGVAHWDAGRFEEALERFIVAYEVSGNPSVLLNVAAAQTQLGRGAEAAASYRRLIASDDPRAQRHAALAREALAELEPRLSRLSIAVEGIHASDTLWVDEREIAREGSAVDVEVDAGEHHVSVRRGDEVITSETLTVAAGEATPVTLRVTPVVPAPESAAPAPLSAARVPMVAPRTRELTEEPWFWGAVGGGGALVVLAVAITLAAVLGAAPATFTGSFEPGQLWVR